MVVHPESTEDVVKIVKIAVEYKMPVTPYSGGTSLEGNLKAVCVTLLILTPFDRWIVFCSTLLVGYV